MDKKSGIAISVLVMFYCGILYLFDVSSERYLSMLGIVVICIVLWTYLEFCRIFIPITSKRKLRRYKEEASSYSSLISAFALEFALLAKKDDGKDDKVVLLFGVIAVVFIVFEYYHYYMEVADGINKRKKKRKECQNGKK